MATKANRMENEAEQKTSGVGLAIGAAILASILFSGKGILAKAGMAHGTTALEMLALRMALAAPIYAGILFWSLRKRPVPFLALMKSVALGLLGCYICPSMNFYGLETVSASLERVLIHTIPAFVLAMTALTGRGKLSLKAALALGVCYAGVAVSCLGRDGARASADAVGVVSILASCVTYAYFLVQSMAMQKRIGAITFTSVAMLASALACIVQSVVTGHSGMLFSPPEGVFPIAFALAVLCTVFPAYLSAYGIKVLGASRASVLSMVGPLLTPLAAAAALGEQMSGLQILGFSLVFGAGVVLGVRRM